MRHIFSLVGLLAFGLLAGMTTIAKDAQAQSVCYAFDPIFANERYRLDIRIHSRLTTLAERSLFGHPLQNVYDVQGKHVGTCGGSTVRPAEGSIHAITPPQSFGARMGLTSLNTTWPPDHLTAPVGLFGDPDSDLICRDVEISCKSGIDGQFPPDVWHCAGENKFGLAFTFDLVQVDPLQDPRCSLFENGDGGNGVILGLEGPEGPSSGTAPVD